jgi:hypothetical protein
LRWPNILPTAQAFGHEQQKLLGKGLGSVGWHSHITGSPTDEQPSNLWTRAVDKGHHDDPFDLVMRNDTTPPDQVDTEAR